MIHVNSGAKLKEIKDTIKQKNMNIKFDSYENISLLFEKINELHK